MDINNIIIFLFFIISIICFFILSKKEVRHLEEEKAFLQNKQKVYDEILSHQWQQVFDFADEFHELSLQLLEESGYSLDKNGIVIIPDNPTNDNKTMEK